MHGLGAVLGDAVPRAAAAGMQLSLLHIYVYLGGSARQLSAQRCAAGANARNAAACSVRRLRGLAEATTMCAGSFLLGRGGIVPV